MGIRGGLYELLGMEYPFIAVKDEGSVADALLPSILSPRSYLVGETTRRYDLNLDRGSGTLGAQHIVRKREPHRGNSAKVAHSRMAPKVISV